MPSTDPVLAQISEWQAEIFGEVDPDNLLAISIAATKVSDA
jgi:hypothetical protein